MIHRTDYAWQSDPWQQLLSNAIRDPQELKKILKLQQLPVDDGLLASTEFSLLVPQPYLSRIKPGDINDPLLAQIMPRDEELQAIPGYTDDPLEEMHSTPLPGLIHKYHGRVLLIVSGGCAINCRYCFRRHFDYSNNTNSRQYLRDAVDYIASDPNISEVILSGGDPLAAKDSYLSELVSELGTLPQLKRLRIHTRLPIVIPQRITDDCLSWLGNTKLQTIMVIHCNHPNEIDRDVLKALRLLKDAEVTLLNQSVLLRGVNDSAATLSDLSEALFDGGVLPYYLHLLDPVRGSSRFEVAEIDARKLVGMLCKQLPGYLVPKLVKESPKMASKLPVLPIF